MRRFLLSLLSVAPLLALIEPSAAAAAPPAPQRLEVKPLDEALHLMRGVAATGAQVGSYAVCWLAVARDDTCVKIADKALRLVTRAG